MMDNSESIKTLHSCGVRPSVHRIAVLEYVANRKTHPTADEIFNAIAVEFPTVSRTTVYNSLHTLVDAGVVRELDIESSTKHYDFAHQKPHSHFRCTRCGRIFDMALPPGLECAVMPGFVIATTDLCFSGVCPDCAGSQDETDR